MPFWKLLDAFLYYCLTNTEKHITQCYNEFVEYLKILKIPQPSNWMLMIRCGEYAREHQDKIYPQVAYSITFFENVKINK